jgi:hypothetical protein
MINQNYLPKIRMNKKADLSILLFVILALVLFGYTLFSIISHRGKAEARITDFDKIEEMILTKKDIEYRLTKLGEECFVITYENFTKEGKFLEEPLGRKNGIYVFTELKEDLENEYIEETRICMNKEGVAILRRWNNEHLNPEFQIKNPFLWTLYNIPIDLKIESSKSYKITFKDFEIAKEDKFNYKINLTTNINLGKIGLLSFQDIKEVTKCGEEDCREKISKGLFEIEVEEIEIEEEIYNKYHFTSKREFLLNNEFKKIEFEFLVKKN